MAFNAETGAVLWKTNVAERPPGAAGLIVFGGASDGTDRVLRPEPERRRGRRRESRGWLAQMDNRADCRRARYLCGEQRHDRVWCSVTRLTELCERCR